MGMIDHRDHPWWDKDANDWDYTKTVPAYAAGALGNDFTCVDCGADTSTHGLCEAYHVTDAVWHAAGMGQHDGMLCIGCLEARLDRRLTRSDFPRDPTNTVPTLRRSVRLASRLADDKSGM